MIQRKQCRKCLRESVADNWLPQGSFSDKALHVKLAYCPVCAVAELERREQSEVGRLHYLRLFELASEAGMDILKLAAICCGHDDEPDRWMDDTPKFRDAVEEDWKRLRELLEECNNEFDMREALCACDRLFHSHLMLAHY